MKTTIKNILAASAVILLAGCSSNDPIYDTTHLNPGEITPSPVNIPASVEAPDPIRIGVNTVPGWHVESTAEWITIDEASVTETGFTINVEAYGPFGEESRTGIVMLHSLTGEQPIVVNQPRRDFIFEDYLGTWTMTADVRNIWGQTGMTQLEETVTMVDSRAETPNTMYFWTIMTYDDNYSMDFTFDEATGGLSFQSYNAGWFETRFAYFNGTNYVTLFAGLPYAKLDPITGKLTIPATVSLGGTEYPVHFYAYSVAFSMDWFYDSIYNIEFTKQDLIPGVPSASAMGNAHKEADRKIIDRKMR